MMPSKQHLWVAGLLLIALAAPAPREASSAEVRVRLFERAEPQAIIVSADRGLFFFSDDDTRGSALAELRPYEKATIRRRGDELYVTFRDTNFRARALRLLPRDDALFSVEVIEGQLLRDPRRYPGSLSLTISRAPTPMLMLVNHVRLDEYVACVVSREYSFNDLEGTKAMAVLARTYVLRNAHATGGAYDMVDHQMDQHYEGANRLTDAAIEATIQTLGEVLTYDGQLVEALYFSSSGGHTADNETVWNGKPVPYLRGVPDPYDAVSPHTQWHTSLPRAALLRALSDHFTIAVEDFRISRRSREGRVQIIELVRPDRPPQVIQGNDFRLLLNKNFGITSLKSTLFEVQRTGQASVFDGRGFGHGVGLSQYGALGMSKQGFSYRDILSFYFAGTQVQRWRTG